MATGLMSLAYMAEVAVVFNLAYLELNKSRYLATPKRAIDALRKDVDQSPDGPDVTWMKGKLDIQDRLSNLLSDLTQHRQTAWYVTNHVGDDSNLQHLKWGACHGYTFFDKEKDKELCQQSLILSGFLLILITVADQFDASSFILMDWHLIAGTLMGLAVLSWLAKFIYGKLSAWPAGIGLGLAIASGCASRAEALRFSIPDYSLRTWWWFFWCLMLVLTAPVICIAIGRRVRSNLEASIADAKKQFEQLKAKALP